MFDDTGSPTPYHMPTVSAERQNIFSPPGTPCTNLPNILIADDSAYTSMFMAGAASAKSYHLLASGYGFNIPAGHTISGIEVSMRLVEVVAGGSSQFWQPTKTAGSDIVSGTQNGTASSTYTATGVPYVVTVGGAGNMLGITLTQAQANDPGFGYTIAWVRSNNAPQQDVDHIKVRLYHA